MKNQKNAEKEYNAILFITLFYSIVFTVIFTVLEITGDNLYKPVYWLYLICGVSTYFLLGLLFIHTKDKTRRTKELPTIPVRKGRLTNPKIKNAEREILDVQFLQRIYNPHTGKTTHRMNEVRRN